MAVCRRFIQRKERIVFVQMQINIENIASNVIVRLHSGSIVVVDRFNHGISMQLKKTNTT